MRTIYQLLMSAFAGTVVGGVVANLIDIMDPEFQVDYGLVIAFFTAITWGLLALLDALFRRPPATPTSAPARR